MTLVREFNLYLTAGRTIPLVINVNQFDSGEQWAFTIYKEDGTQYIPSTGAIVGIKSDNLGIINSGTVDENGRVIITETQQMTASVGKAVFELTLDSGTHGTANFVVLVEEKPGNNADLSDSDLSLIQEALNAVSPLPTGGTVGQVLTKTAQGSAWSDAGTPTQEQVAEAVADWADENITVTTGVVIDQSLSVQGAAADAKATGDEISELKSQIQSGGVLKESIKTALLACFQNVIGTDGFDEAYNSLYSALNDVEIVSISAVFTQEDDYYFPTDNINALKRNLTVTAHYDNGTSGTVTSYTLSGTLEEGTSTITVTYEGKTTTFNVSVTAWDIDWNYTEGLPSTETDFAITNNSNLFAQTLQDNGVDYSCSNTSSTAKYVFITPSTTACTKAIAEYVFIPYALPGGNGTKLTLSNGTSGARISALSSDSGTSNASASKSTNLGLYYMTGSSDAWNESGNTKISNLTANSEYKVKLDYEHGQTNRVYLNDELVHSSTEMTSSYATNSRLAIQSNQHILLKAVRFKFLQV